MSVAIENGQVFIDGSPSSENDIRGQRIRFFYHQIQNEEMSKQHNRPIYQDIEMVEVVSSGNKDVFHGKVTDIHRARYRSHYQRFKENETGRMEGTPLDQFPFITASERKEFEYFNVFTAEQLIHMADGNIDRVGVATRDLIKKVKAYMEAAKDNSVIPRLAEENEHLKREIEILKEQMKQFFVKNESNASMENGIKNLKKGKKNG